MSILKFMDVRDFKIMIVTATINQMIFLFLLMGIGYLLAKLRLVPDNTEGILSKLENYIFVPALAMGTFMANFTVEKLSSMGELLIWSLVIEIVVIPVSMLIVRLCAKDKYTRNIYLYGLSFANFGFMGNAVVSALFPNAFMEYIIFTLVLWVAIYAWGVPILLMGDTDKKMKIGDILKKFVNPMFIAMAVGMIVGILNINVPTSISSLVTSLGNCMSPIAMLLTGMTIARKDLFGMIKIKSVYAITGVRLLLYPLIFLGIALFVPMNETILICAVCSLAMPLGLNTIVIPGAYGKDTTIASSMALISHVLSCVTIPIIFMLLELLKNAN